MYLLANREDRRLKMSVEMRELLSSEGCPRDYLKKYFGGGESHVEEETGMELDCCHHHDTIAHNNL